MQRLIILQLHYEEGPAVRAAAFKQFRSDIKQWPYIKIIKETEAKAWVIIDFPEDRYQTVYDGLRTLDVVEIIDSILPPTL